MRFVGALQPGWSAAAIRSFNPHRNLMNNLIYIVGLIVVVVAVLSFFGLR